MIKLDGSLSVKSISGRNGVFSVGKLTTPIGEFTVKDTILDQYPEGKYDGEFLISKIFPCSYVMRGNVVVEVRAVLDEVIISESSEESQHQEPTISDPIEETPPAGNMAPAVSSPASEALLSEATAIPSDDGESGSEAIMFGSEQAKQDRELFGDLYDILAAMFDLKLDPTVDRAKFRAQRDRLKELGYKFDAPTQAWVLP